MKIKKKQKNTCICFNKKKSVKVISEILTKNTIFSIDDIFMFDKNTHRMSNNGMCFEEDIFKYDDIIIIKDLTFTRIQWIGYFSGIVLSSYYEYNRSKSYAKVLLDDDKFGYFLEWFSKYFKLSRYDDGYSFIPYFGFYRLNQISFYKPPKNKNMECIRFGGSDPNSVWGQKYTYAKNVFDQWVIKHFGNDKKILHEFNKYFEMGKNMLPINVDMQLDKKFDSKSFNSKIIKYFKKYNIPIDTYGANRLKVFIRGVEEDCHIYKKPICINSKIFSDSDKYNIGIFIKNKYKFRSINNGDKRKVLDLYKNNVFNYETSEIIKQNKLFYNIIRNNTLERIWRKGVTNDFEIDSKECFCFHHLVFVQNLKRFCLKGFDIHNPILIIPMLTCDHKKLHGSGIGNDEGKSMDRLANDFIGVEWCKKICQGVYKYTVTSEINICSEKSDLSRYLGEIWWRYL